MTFNLGIFFTSPTDEFLNPDGRDIKELILQRFRDACYKPQFFFVKSSGTGQRTSWVVQQFIMRSRAPLQGTCCPAGYCRR